ncbi:hypothetical protein WJX84_000657 [Apatococcus fuscideae]|uniref:CID domain-containing protein n=1 Tax=Apatococcus fuscideae TaxID=2026836 RepID=A0AAW1SWP5_9CHLO
MASDSVRDFILQYKAELEDLTSNVKVTINTLSQLADEWKRDAAPSVAALLEKRLLNCDPSHKLPALYLLDSIVKNVRQPYISLFARNLPEVFSKVWQSCEDAHHAVGLESLSPQALKAHNPTVIQSLILLPEDIKAKHRGVLHRQQQRKRKAIEQPTSRHWYADSVSWIKATTVDATRLAQEQQVAEAEEQRRVIPTVPVDDAQRECALSGERFETVWDAESEDWHYLGAVRLSAEEAARYGLAEGMLVLADCLSSSRPEVADDEPAAAAAVFDLPAGASQSQVKFEDASALPDGEPGQPKGSRSLKAGFKSFFAGNKAGKKGSKPCAGELPKENQPYVSWGQSLDPRAASRSLSPLRPLGHSNSPGLQAEGHAFPRNLDRVSLPELQSALGLRIPAAPAMLSLPASPTAQPAVNPPSTAMSIQASAEWPDNRGGALPGSMMMDSSGLTQETVIKSAATLPAGHLKPLPGSAVAATEPCREAVDPQLSMRASRQSTGSAATYTSAEFESFTRDVAARIIQHYWRKNHAASASGAHARDAHGQLADAPLHDLPHSNLPDRMPGGSQERPPFVPATLLGSKLPEQAAAKDHSQQHASHLQDTTITSTAIGSREPGEDADLPTQLSPFQLEAGTTAAISPDQQADGQPARGDSASFNRASNPDSMVSYTSDAEQSITSSIVAHIMQGQQDGRLLSTASIESSVSGRTALQQEGWRAPKHHRRAPKDKVPLTSPRLIRKQSLQHRSVPTELAASVELPDHTLHPKKRQHRREARPLPPPSLQNEGWHRREDIAVAEPAVASGHPASDGSLHLGSAGAKPDKSGPNLAASSSPQPSAALPQSLSPIPAVMASFSAGQTLALPATSAVPLEVPGDTAKVLPTAIPSAAAAPVSTGQNDKMKDIMAFLDVVEAQIDAQPTLAVGTHQGQVAREALAEITRSQLPPQLQPRLPAATAARIQSWVQDAAQNDAGSESGSQKSGRSLASHGGSSTHLASSVFQGVRAKLSQLKLDVSEKGQLVQKLQGNLKASEAMIQAQAAAAAARQQEVLEQQRKEYEGTIARHLQFVDRLLKDKDDLSTRCAALASDVKSGEQQLATQAAMLREGWALELKRHKDAWAMGEKSRKEAWQAAKMREIKEMTIKGLEPDIEQMRRQHKDDLRHATQQAQEMAKLQVEEKDQEWEKRARQTRQQALLDLDDAVRKERVAGQGRIQEVIERYEAQLQMQRMRLASDKDCAQEQVQSALAEEHKQHRAALDLREQDKAKSEEKLRQQFAEEREQLQRTCDRRLAQLREEYDSNQAGFRAAVAERAKRELATREKAMRERLITERDRELQFVMERLEGEAAEKEAASKAGTQESSRKAAAEHSAALQAAAKAEARVTKRFEQAAHEAAESAKQLQKLERRFEELRTERAAAEEESEDLANQLAVTKKEAAQLQKGMQQAQQNQAQATAALVASLQSKVDAATAQAESIRAKGAVEMLQKKDSIFPTATSDNDCKWRPT